MKRFQSSRLYLWLFVCILAAGCLLLSVKVPFVYAVNDDLFMKNIVSGAYLGVPDAHTVYMEYPLSALLAMLYRISASVPWYGICFFCFHMLSWGAAVYRLCGGKKMAWGFQSCFSFLLGMLLFASCGFYHVANIQFTVTAAMLGAAGLVWFMTGDLNQSLSACLRDQAVTALFVFLSFNVRRNVLLMLVPIAGMLWLRKVLALWQERAAAVDATVNKKIECIDKGSSTDQILPSGKASWSGKKTRSWFYMSDAFAKGTVMLLFVAVLSATCVAVTFISYGIAYGDDGWRDYILYNDNATILYDYYGWPDYTENCDLYKELGISEEAYVGARDAYLLSVDSGVDSAAMVRLAERSKKLHEERGSLGERVLHALRETGIRAVSETDRPLNLVVLSLYGLTALGILYRRRYTAFYTVGALVIGRMFSWMYVVYEGRYPMRISQSLFLAEVCVLAAVLCREVLPDRGVEILEAEMLEMESEAVAERAKGQAETKAKMQNIRVRLLHLLLITTACLYFLLLAAFGYVRLKHVYTENSWRIAESQDLKDLQEYCRDNSTYFYFVDTKSITNDTELIFDAGGSRLEPYIVFGGWLSDSPVFLRKTEENDAADVESAILEDRARIIVENEERCPTEYLERYFASKYEGRTLHETDAFGRGGDQFIVYRVY